MVTSCLLFWIRRPSKIELRKLLLVEGSLKTEMNSWSRSFPLKFGTWTTDKIKESLFLLKLKIINFSVQVSAVADRTEGISFSCLFLDLNNNVSGL